MPSGALVVFFCFLLLVYLGTCASTHSTCLHAIGASRRSIEAASVLSWIRGSDRFSRIRDAFETREATIESVHHALLHGNASCHSIVSAHLSRIEAFNPSINALITLNHDALSTATELDRILAKDPEAISSLPLFCIPTLLKDNFDDSTMPTTAGSLSLRSLRPDHDAPIVSRLKRAGAVVLGKTNMQELALEGLTVSSLGGQTLNPYDLTRTPGGSSGGSGAALAAGFAVLATGTDTMNSLRNPASANSLVSLRPSRGMLSRTGVMPVSDFQDVVGPMARTVPDLAVMYKVMLGEEGDVESDMDDDQATKDAPRSRSFEFIRPECPEEIHLLGLRFGVVEPLFDWSGSKEGTIVNEAMACFFAKLQRAGAELVPVRSPFLDPVFLSSLDMVRHEIRRDVDTYLSHPGRRGSFPRSFAGIFQNESMTDFLVLPAQQELITAALSWSPQNDSYSAKRGAAAQLVTDLAGIFDVQNLDFMLYPEQRNLVVRVGAPSQRGRNGHLAVMTGSPVLTLPAGFSPPDASAPRGVPIGAEMLGRPGTEELLFRTGAIIESLARERKTPEMCDKELETAIYDEIPSIVSNTWDIPKDYPIGVR